MNPGPIPTRVVRIPDCGRELAVDICGPETGHPVFLLHGTPGSRLGPRPRTALLHRLNIRLISYDRPGYGRSTRTENGRTVADAANDIRAISDALDLKTFAVLGRSGGGPHAMAAAAALSDRVTQLVVLVPLAPADAHGLDWFEGMNEGNLREFATVENDDQSRTLRDEARLLAECPNAFIDDLLAQVSTDQDRAILRNPVFRQLLRETYTESVRQGAGGWIDDDLALRNPWQIDFDRIRCPTKIWHGQLDAFSPIEHSDWLRSRLTHAELQIDREAGHFSAMQQLPALLSWISRGYSEARGKLLAENGAMAAMP